MSIALAQIFRHPIKSHGCEALSQAALTEGACLPWDRHWAVAHEAAKFDTSSPGWVACVNFSRGAKAARLMAIKAEFDEELGVISLSHPDLPLLSFRPDDAQDAARFIDWVRPICPPDRAMPKAVVSVPGRGMTDTDFPSVSVLNLASNASLSAQTGHDLSPRRWRGNLWLDGLPAWAEFDLIGRRLRIGGAELEIRERIGRCKATSANPETGVIDVDTLGALDAGHGHQDFGVYAVVVAGGTIACGDKVEVI